ncbi:MAG: DNA-directed DNA polymerase II small subunit [Promethearchaeota archaeon]
MKRSDDMTSNIDRTILEKCLTAGMNISPAFFRKVREERDPVEYLDRLLKKVLTRPDVPPVLCSDVLPAGSVDGGIPIAHFTSEGPVDGREGTPGRTEAQGGKNSHGTLGHGAPKTAGKVHGGARGELGKNLPVGQLQRVPMVSPRAVPAQAYQAVNEPARKPPVAGIPVKRHSRSTGGFSNFKPYAREVDASYRVLSDPTENVFTDGELSGFLSVFKDRFDKMRRLFRKRGDVGDALPINEVVAMDSDAEVKVIGMVVQKRQAKSGNYLVEVEDPTGRVMALVTQRDGELFERVNHLLLDQVICVVGYLRVNKSEGRKGQIIIANDFFWPDIPNDHERQHPEEKVSAVMLSDMHFGSKNHLSKLWERFVDFINGRVGNRAQRELAGSIKYVLIAGDLVDGIGIYPNQEKELEITDIFEQYAYAAERLAEIPEYVKVIYSPGNHDPVRKAQPQPSVSRKYSGVLRDNLDVDCVGNPALVQIHGIKTLMYHGESLIDINMTVPGLSNDKPVEGMKELLRGRHLGPTFGKKLEVAPCEVDWLVVEDVPDILHAGHVHINGLGHYRGVLIVNSGCFQAQTSFMKSFGINPTPGQVTVTRLYEEGLRSTILDLQDF